MTRIWLPIAPHAFRHIGAGDCAADNRNRQGFRLLIRNQNSRPNKRGPRNFARVFLNLFYFCADLPGILIYSFCFKRPSRGALRAVLVVRLDSVGDFLMWLPSARLLRSIYPQDQYEITLAANPEWSLFAESLPYWDKVLPIDRSRMVREPAYRWSVLGMVRAGAYDLAIHPVFSHTYLTGDAVIRSSASPQRVGWHVDDYNPSFSLSFRRFQSRVIYTQMIHAPAVWTFEIEKNLQLMSVLAKKSIAYSPIDLLRPERPSLAGSHESGDYFLIVPDSLEPQKEWPLERFFESAMDCAGYFGTRGIFAGRRQELTERIDGFCREHTEFANVMGKTNIVEYFALIANARFVVCNDSSAGHAAALFGVPSFVIAGGREWGRFFPYPDSTRVKRIPSVIHGSMPCYRRGRVCVQCKDEGPYQCIQDVTCEMVSAEVRKRVSRNDRKFDPGATSIC